jgi:hypothetical protein
LKISAYLKDGAAVTIGNNIRYAHSPSIEQHYPFICPYSVSLCAYSLAIEGAARLILSGRAARQP